MYRLVGMEIQTINQKMKCLMYIAVIQCLLGKQCDMKVCMLLTYKYEVYKHDVLWNKFLNTVLSASFLPTSVQSYTFKYLIEIILGGIKSRRGEGTKNHTFENSLLIVKML